MRRFLAAWDAFLGRWRAWNPEFRHHWTISTQVPVSDKGKADVRAILEGRKYAQSYRKPAKKGDRGFRMEGGRG